MRFLKSVFFLAVIFSAVDIREARAADTKAANTDILANVLKKVDAQVCAAPDKIKEFYSPQLTIMLDDRRILLENRIQSYRSMIGEYRGMKCDFKRTVLTGEVGSQLGFLLVDEQISVRARMSTDERQHNVCTYVFDKAGANWKILHEHCSTLPDYTIAPGEDGLYYYHNPVY
jgi:ketosteroid isomerase-like protein